MKLTRKIKGEHALMASKNTPRRCRLPFVGHTTHHPMATIVYGVISVVYNHGGQIIICASDHDGFRKKGKDNTGLEDEFESTLLGSTGPSLLQGR